MEKKHAREKGESYISYTGEMIKAKSAPVGEALCLNAMTTSVIINDC